MADSELIEALEQATGHDRKLDDAIYLLAGFCLHKQSDLTYSGAQSDTGFDCICGANSWGARGKHGERLHDRSKPYTSSIDAAEKLVPEGWTIHLWWRGGWPPEAKLWKHGKEPNPTDIEAEGATPAIALCIAALKARRASDGPATSREGENG